MANQKDTITFVPLKTITSTKDKTKYVIDITEDHPERYIAFITEEHHNWQDFVFFDNLKVENTPACIDIESLSVDNITTTSAGVMIEDATNGAWEIQYSTLPFNEEAVPVKITDKNYSLSELTVATGYALRVRSLCNTADQGAWSELIEFQTRCNAFAVTKESPFFDGFEEGQKDKKPISACWSNTDGLWLANSSLPSYESSPYAGTFNAAIKSSTDSYIYYELDLKANTNYLFSSFVRYGYAYSDYFKVSISDNAAVGSDETVILMESFANGEYNEFSEYFTVLSDGSYFIKVANKGTADYSYLSLDNVSVTLVSCAPPALKTFEVSNLTTNSTSITWEGSAANHFVNLATTEIDPTTAEGNVFSEEVIGNIFSYDALTPNTTYYCYVKAICDVDDESVWSEAYSFTTPCSTFTVPFEEDFEGDISDLECWTYHGNKPFISTSKKHLGKNSWQCSGGAFLVSPELNVESLADYYFSAYIYTQIDTVRMSIGVLTDAADENTFTPISDIVITEKEEWKEIISYFSDANIVLKGAKHVAIFVSDEYSVYFDDIKIDVLPSCPKLTGLTVKEITDNSFNVDWTPNDETSWAVRIMAGDDVVKDTIVNSHPIDITNLISDTEYKVMVRAKCDAIDPSAWAATNIRTLCSSFKKLPFVEDFNHLGNEEIITCWLNDIHNMNEDYSSNYWKAYLGDKTSTQSYMFDTRYNTLGNYSILETPLLDLTGTTSATLEFDMMKADGGEFQVLVSEDNGLTFGEALLTIKNSDRILKLTNYTVDLTSYCGKKIAVGFKGISENTYNDDAFIRIDNVSVYVPSSCAKPASVDITDITHNSVNITIVDESSATQWAVAIVPFGTAMEDVSELIIDEKIYKFEALNAAAKYIVSVRAICGSERSWHISSDLIITHCDKMTLPYIQGFEGIAEVKDILCTSVLGNIENLAFETYADYVYSGAQALTISPSADSYLYFILPEVNEPISDVSLSLYYANNGSSILEVGIIPLYLEEEEFIHVKSFPISEDYTLASVDFAHAQIDPELTSGDYRIAIRSKAEGYGMVGITIDDVKINHRADCVAPLRTECTNITANSADITIVDRINTEWEVAYGLAAAAFLDLTVLSNLTDVDVNLADLLPASQYQLYARGVCDGDFTAWTDKVIFATECVDIAVDEENSYEENFNTYEYNGVPVCWTVLSTEDRTSGGDLLYPAVGDAKSLALLGEATIALPKFSTPINQLYMEIDVEFTGSGEEFSIGYTNDLSTVEYPLVITKTEHGASKRHLIDLTTFPQDAQYIVFKQTQGYGLELDNIKIYPAPDCFEPHIIELINITDASADISYVASAYAANAYYKITQDGVEVITGSSEVNPINIIGLDDKTEYEVSISIECKKDGFVVGTTDWSKAISFSTYQIPATPSYEKGSFEDAAENAMWTVVGTGDNQWIISSTDAGAVESGASALYVSKNASANEYEGTSASKSWAYRTFNLEKGVATLSYSYKLGGSATDYMRVFLVPATLDLSTVDVNPEGLIVADNGSNLYGSTSWSQIDNEINITEAGYYNLAFLWINDEMNAVQAPAAVDNIKFDYSTCASPVVTAISYVGAVDATISFDDYNATAPLSYEAIVKKDNSEITQGDIDAASTLQSESGKLSLSALTSNTQYYVYLRANCTQSDDSKWSSAIIFRTACVAVVIDEANSLAEGFESYVAGTVVENCWVQESGYWKASLAEEGYGIEPRTGIMFAALGSSQTDKLMREVELKSGKTYKVTLWARTDAGKSNVSVGLLTTPGDETSFVEVAKEVVNHGDYQRISGEYSPTADGTYVFMINATHTSNIVNYLSIDDVYLSLSCEEPTDVTVNDITSTTAKINWTSYSDKSHIAVTGGSFSLDTVIDCQSGANGYNIVGISASTEYAVNITNICSQASSDLYTTTFVSSCEAIDLPYREDFDSYIDGEVPTCWNSEEGNVIDHYRWQIATVTNESDMPNKVMRFDSQSSKVGETNTLKAVTINIDRANYIFSFDYKNPDGGAMSVFLSKDQGVTYSDTLLDAVTGIESWTTFTKALTDYNGKEITMVVHSVSNDASGDAFHYLDNIKISCDGGELNIYDTICANNPYEGHGFIVDINETATPGLKRLTREKIATTADECDSTIVLNLTVNAVYKEIIYDTFCEGTVYSKGLFVGLDETGVFTKEFPSTAGCDSTVTLHLSYGNKEVTLIETICEGTPYEFGGENRTSSGMFRHTQPSLNGCDSVTTLYLTVVPKYYETIKVICEGDNVEFEGKTYDKTGRFTHTFKSTIGGCDSIRVLDLTVQQIQYEVDSTICQGQSVFFDGEFRNETGEYTATFIRVPDYCDSVVTLTLTVTPIDTTIVSDHVCEGKSYYNLDYGFSNISISKDSVLYSTVVDEGCDKIIELHLRFTPTQEVYDTVMIAAGESYEFGGNSLALSDDYIHTFQSETNGCDSTVHLNLTIATGLATIEVKTLVLAPNPIDILGYSIIDRDWTLTEQKGMRMEVLNAAGTMLYSSDVTEFPIVVKDLNMSGMYYVRIITGMGDIYIGKLIVK